MIPQSNNGKAVIPVFLLKSITRDLPPMFMELSLTMSVFQCRWGLKNLYQKSMFPQDASCGMSSQLSLTAHNCSSCQPPGPDGYEYTFITTRLALPSLLLINPIFDDHPICLCLSTNSNLPIPHQLNHLSALVSENKSLINKFKLSRRLSTNTDANQQTC